MANGDATEPMTLFDAWLADAAAKEPDNHTAMTLATIGSDGWPAVRVVLLKGADARGFVFYTNYLSQKGRELRATAKASLCFHWKSVKRQVRIDGTVEQVTAAEADAYFATRPRISQLGAWASAQSSPLGSRALLEAKLEEVTREYDDKPVPRPPHWSGYRVLPRRLEFWEERPFRLHERLVYDRDGAAWRTSRLYP
ncbi:MAG: pyridoxamine 5'-phosphate oxidase [Alphaproteobacteria bacterium]|nr:pyridoxamine 5'-phosphate oxidase [Alphaproteobacteria bacterium]